MKGRRRSSGSSSRVRFWGSEGDRAHRAYYRFLADHYDALYGEPRYRLAYPFLHSLFRRRGPVTDVLDVACGTFALDLPLVKRGYRVTGRDLSDDMIHVARRNLARAGRTADIGTGDMRTLQIHRSFDAVLCLGTAFNYLSNQEDVRRALRSFRRHLRPGGLLVLDLTNFEPWIRHPENARAEVDYRPDERTRLAIFAYNEQNPSKTVHLGRFLIVHEHDGRIDLALDSASMRVWTRATLADALTKSGFHPVEWHGDLRLGTKYRPRKSPRLVAVAERT